MARQIEMAEADSEGPSEAVRGHVEGKRLDCGASRSRQLRLMLTTRNTSNISGKVTAEIVQRITEPFKDRNPVYFLLEGFMICGVVVLGFWISERLWLKQNLSLASFWDPEIDKRMYPLLNMHIPDRNTYNSMISNDGFENGDLSRAVTNYARALQLISARFRISFHTKSEP
eukprot:758249-Hanusia_phi.AAC.1